MVMDEKVAPRRPSRPVRPQARHPVALRGARRVFLWSQTHTSTKDQRVGSVAFIVKDRAINCWYADLVS